jgi:uncharacterized protein
MPGYHSKLYFYDVGLVSWLLGIRTTEQMISHPLRSSIFETFILSELIKLKLNQGEKPVFSFWRDSNGNEVDLLVEKGVRLNPVEIKSGRTLTHEAFTGLNKWCALAGEKAGVPTLVYAGDESYKHKGTSVLGWKECGRCCLQRHSFRCKGLPDHGCVCAHGERLSDRKLMR